MASKLTISESSLRRVISKILKEGDGGQTTTTVAGSPDFIKQGFKGIIKGALSQAPDNAKKSAIVATLLGGDISLPGSGIFSFGYPHGSDPATIAGTEYRTIFEFADTVVTNFKGDPEGISEWTSTTIVSNLDGIFENGINVPTVYNGKLTGSTVNVRASYLVFTSLAFQDPSADAAGNIAGASVTDLSNVISEILLGARGQGKVNFGERAMAALGDVSRKMAQGAINSVTDLTNTIDVAAKVTPSTSQVQYSAEYGTASVPAEAVTKNLGEIADASRAVQDAANGIGVKYALNGALVADYSSDIVEAISGFTVLGREAPGDIFQTKSDLVSLANAIIGAYDTGLLILDSAPNLIDNPNIDEDAFSFRSDKLMGLSAAVYGAAKMQTARSWGSLWIIGLSVLGEAALAAVALKQLSAKKPSLLLKMLGGISNMIVRGKDKWAVRTVRKEAAGSFRPPAAGASIADQEAYYAAVAKREKELLTARTESSVLKKSWSQIYDEAFSGWKARRLELRALRDEAKAKIEADFAKDVEGARAIIRDIDSFPLTSTGEAEFIARHKYALEAAPGFGPERAEAVLKQIWKKYVDSMPENLGDIENAEELASLLVPLEREAAETTLKDSLIEMKRLGNQELTDYANQLLKDKDLADFLTTARVQTAKGLTVGAILSAFFGWVMGRAVQGLLSAGPDGGILTAYIMGLNQVDENGAIAITTQAERIALLSEEGNLSSTVDNLIDSLSFDTGKFFNPSAVQAMKNLAEACGEAMRNAADLKAAETSTSVNLVITRLGELQQFD